LQCLEFEGGLLGGGLFLGLEVATDADAMEAAIDAEREHAIPVLKPADGEHRLVIHA
jgi:hypothetical protein